MNRFLSPRSILSLLLVLLTAGVVFLLGGCHGGDSGADETDQVHEAGGPGDENPGDLVDGEQQEETRIYTVRGEIQEVPDPEDPLSGLYIRHEAVDDFVGMDGEIQGMDSMTMPFPAAEDLTFEGIEPGDKIEFTLEVSYDADPILQVTEIRKLPDDTELKLRQARPPG